MGIHLKIGDRVKVTEPYRRGYVGVVIGEYNEPWWQDTIPRAYQVMFSNEEEGAYFERDLELIVNKKSMATLKVGDRVRIRSGASSSYSGCEGEVYAPYQYGEPAWTVLFGGGNTSAFVERDLELIETKQKTMNIKDSFTLAFKAEPEKTFRKLGITNGDDFLTEDGQKIFLSWLLRKYGADFKKEVADDLLAEQEKSKKDN